MINPSFDQHEESPTTPLISHDQCIVTIDDAHDGRDTARRPLLSSNTESDIAENILPLPEHKYAHVFISHSNDDFEQVMEIVNELEERFHVSCIIANRDFQSGKNIIANIKDSIEGSLKTVFMLTPTFIQSNFCKFERDIAFMTSVESGINSVIPVLLKECDIPISLATITYIDGTLPGIDIPAKIAHALTRSELAKASLMSEYQAPSKKYENGYSFPIVSKKVKVCSGWKNSEYMFYLNEGDLNQLRQAKVKLPKEVINVAISVVNKQRLVIPGHYHFRQGVWVLLVVVFLYILIAIGTSSQFHLESFKHYLMATVAISGIVTIVQWWKGVRRNCFSDQRQDEANLALWETIGETCIQHNAIVSVEMYLASLIRDRERGRTTQSTSPESQADEKIRRAIKQLMLSVTSGLEEIPDAPYNRHPVRKSKMCLCQLIEAGFVN